MANRREFLQASLAASAFAALTPVSGAAVSSATTFPFHTVLFDKRFADSVRFAAACAEQGGLVHGMEKGDITPFWRDELSAVWSATPVPLAGMTTEGPLFCLEQLGRQYGLRVVQRETQPSGLIAWVVAPVRGIETTLDSRVRGNDA